ncbi:CARDB domain-containing protein [Planctomycetota bacterium]
MIAKRVSTKLFSLYVILFFTTSSFAAVDLVPYKMDTWGDKIVVADVRDKFTDGTIYANARCYIALSVGNGGNTGAGSFYVDIWDQTENKRIVHERIDRLDALRVISVYNITHTFKNTGYHTLRIKVDASSEVSESNESNNEYTRQINVKRSYPDLIPAKVNPLAYALVVSNKAYNPLGGGTYYDGSVTTKQQAHLGFGVDNIGKVGTGASYWIRIWDDTTKEVIIERHSDPQDVDVDKAFFGTWTFKTPGSHRLILTVDSKNNVSESNENNNTYTKQINVAAPPLPKPIKANNPKPSKGAANQSTTISLSWSNGGHATSYDIYFGTDSTPDSGESKGNQSGRTYNPGTLQYNTTYYWRIDAKNAQGTTTGAIWNFTTKQAPSEPNTNIIWISDFDDKNNDGIPDDQEWVDILEAEGYTVDYTPGPKAGNGFWRTLDSDKITALNAADLIIVSSNTSSPSYDDADETEQWNAITTPIILSYGYLVRSSTWKWLDTTSLSTIDAAMDVISPDDALFEGVTIEANSQVQAQDASIGRILFPNIIDPGNGIVLATVAGVDALWIIEWEAGEEYYNGAGQIAGGPRMFFATGTIKSDGKGKMNLTDDGLVIFLNAVNKMIITSLP